MMHFERIQMLRDEAGLSRKQVARIIGISTTKYKHIEAGSRPLPVVTAIAISYLYGVSMDYLLGISNNRKRSPDERILK